LFVEHQHQASRHPQWGDPKTSCRNSSMWT